MATAKRYNTGKPCGNGHFSDRYESSGACIVCLRNWKRSYRSMDKHKLVARAGWATYAAKKRDVLNQKARERHANNKDVHNQRSRHWRESNKPKKREYERRAKARRRNCVPPWVDRDAILAVYVEAQRLTEETGVLHEVDHIVPIAGKTVCGLHVPWNLRPLPWLDNRKKHAKLIEEESHGV